MEFGLQGTGSIVGSHLKNKEEYWPFQGKTKADFSPMDPFSTLLLPSYTTALFFPSPQSQSSPTSDMGTLGQAVLLEFFSVASVSYNVFTQPLKSSFLLALLLK